jgi:hypothetical protein
MHILTAPAPVIHSDRRRAVIARNAQRTGTRCDESKCSRRLPDFRPIADDIDSYPRKML